MRKIIVTALGAALIAATAQMAAASEPHHVRKAERAITSEPFRNANNAVASPPAQPGWYYGGYSAPAGH